MELKDLPINYTKTEQCMPIGGGHEDLTALPHVLDTRKNSLLHRFLVFVFQPSFFRGKLAVKLRVSISIYIYIVILLPAYKIQPIYIIYIYIFTKPAPSKGCHLNPKGW